MIAYILNFALCSGLMLAIYYLLLSRESMYRFNRFYLLFALAFSAIAPLVSIDMPYEIPFTVSKVAEVTRTTQPTAAVEQQTVLFTDNREIMDQEAQFAISFNYKAYLPVIIYALVAVALLIRFLLVSIRMGAIWNKGKEVRYGDTTLVLLDDNITPHSFLNNIYISRGDFESGIDPQIICHERAHIEQMHSVDIIIIELLQIVCWFNPFIPLYRKFIKLNHEYLADNAVLRNFNDAPQYQMLLLAKATQGSALYLPSQFNYQTTKKRLIMMTKTTSHKKALYKALLILPAVAISLLLSCNSVTQDKDTSKATRDTVTKPFGKNLDRQVYRIEHSITPASKQVLDEYAALLEKYNLTGLPPNSLPITQSDEPQSPEAQDKWDQFDIQLKTMLKKVSTTDKARLNELFTKMDSTQQVNQYLIFAPAPIPLAKNSVTAQQLARWGSSKEYLVFIDNKPVPYTKLAKYKPEDFDWGKVNSAVNSQGRKEGFKYKVALLTKPFYADYYNNIMADRSDHMAYHVKTGEKSFWMAYL